MDQYNHIQNRPKELFKIEYYTRIPSIVHEFAYSSLPQFLHIDLAEFFGIMPLTKELTNIQSTFHIEPSQKEIEYYKKKDTSFQIINVVANIHTFKTENDKIIGYPYSISLIPAQFRGEPDYCSVDYIESMELGKPSEQNFIYSNFSPFKKNDRGLYMNLSLIAHPETEIYTDTIGFVLEKYYLRTDIDLDDILILGPHNFDPTVIQKYYRYRTKRYFKPFTILSIKYLLNARALRWWAFETANYLPAPTFINCSKFLFALSTH